MQTFLPFPSFVASAHVLDNKRLGKQRVECLQILNALSDPSYGWQNHPAVKMWRGHEGALCEYAIAICEEWFYERMFKDTLLPEFQARAQTYSTEQFKDPHWYRNKEFHRSHQSNLIRKDPAFYGPKFPGVPADLPYVWPCGVSNLPQHTTSPTHTFHGAPINIQNIPR